MCPATHSHRTGPRGLVAPAGSAATDNDPPQIGRLFAEGDRDAFRQIVEEHSHSLYKRAWRITGNPGDAEDVVQEVFLKAYQKRNQFEAASAVSTWLFRITINCAVDVVRRRRGDPEATAEATSEAVLHTLESTDPSPERTVQSKELRRRMARSLQSLSDNERIAFTLRHFDGVPLREIGEVLGLSLNATKNTVFRAVQKLRQTLQPPEGTSP